MRTMHHHRRYHHLFALALAARYLVSLRVGLLLTAFAVLGAFIVAATAVLGPSWLIFGVGTLSVFLAIVWWAAL